MKGIGYFLLHSQKMDTYNCGELPYEICLNIFNVTVQFMGHAGIDTISMNIFVLFKEPPKIS